MHHNSLAQGHFDLPVPKPAHTMGGAGRSGVGQGAKGETAAGPAPGRYTPILPSNATKTTVLDASSEARTKEALYKPNRRTRRAVDDRFDDLLTTTLFPDMPCIKIKFKKRFTKTIRRRYTGQQPGTKSARGPADKLRIWEVPRPLAKFDLFRGPNRSQVCNQGHRMIQKLAPRLREPAGPLPSALLFSQRLGYETLR